MVTTLKSSSKFYTDNPEVVESEIERLKELVRLNNEVKLPIIPIIQTKRSKSDNSLSATQGAPIVGARFCFSLIGFCYG